MSLEITSRLLFKYGKIIIETNLPYHIKDYKYIGHILKDKKLVCILETDEKVIKKEENIITDYRNDS